MKFSLCCAAKIINKPGKALDPRPICAACRKPIGKPIIKGILRHPYTG